LEDGILTDGKGRTVSFKNTVLIMTSNIGSKRILELVQSSRQSNDTMSDKRREGEYSQLTGVVKSELEAIMTPEFLNRIDDIVVFEPFSAKELSLIAVMMVVEITTRAQIERQLDLTVSRRLLQKMVEQGSASAVVSGARPMRRAVQRILEEAISDCLVQGFLEAGDVATFDVGDVEEEVHQQVGDMDGSNASFSVRICRTRGGEELCLEVEASSRDMIVDPPPSRENGGPRKEDEQELLENSLVVAHERL
jgi:ATP-dependent Clp protease ATP-binding subunit ClpC